ncbi:hypothetical protein J6TS2_11730 [Heyndrickxia sporothermodurans]|nr:hypothetical protein J6TS2_11730 [Heyndrickxia sporothermodurans]
MSNMIELYSKEIKQELIKLEKKLKKVRIEAFLINNGRERIFEYLKNKKVREKPSKVYSVTKTIISILIGILVDKGMIKDIHVPIYTYSRNYYKRTKVRKRKFQYIIYLQ